MKRFYAILLLFAFLVGSLQPILPMIRYQLFEGNISELVTHAKEDSSKSIQTVDVAISHHGSTHRDDTAKSLINDNYYPLGIDTTMVTSMYIFPFVGRLYLPMTQSVESPSFIPSPPPPRVA